MSPPPRRVRARREAILAFVDLDVLRVAGSGRAGTACVGTLAPPRACCFSTQALSLAGGGLAVRARRAAACFHAPATQAREEVLQRVENLPCLCVTSMYACAVLDSNKFSAQLNQFPDLREIF